MDEGLLEVGSTAPAFEAETSDGGRVSLPELLREQAVLLMFYPVDDTPGCTRQMCLARDEGERYREAGVARFGVNPGGLESHRSFAGKYALDFPLIVDDGMRIAAAYRVRRDDGYTARATYLVGRDGLIAFAQAGTHGADPVLEALGG